MAYPTTPVPEHPPLTHSTPYLTRLSLIVSHLTIQPRIEIELFAPLPLTHTYNRRLSDNVIMTRPDSLYEGTAGMVCLLADLLKDPAKSAFPGFEDLG